MKNEACIIAHISFKYKLFHWFYAKWLIFLVRIKILESQDALERFKQFLSQEITFSLKCGNHKRELDAGWVRR